MTGLMLSHSVRTLEGGTLLEAGSVLSEEVMEAVCADQPAGSFRSFPLLSHGSVKSDLLRFFSVPPYSLIFLDGQITDVLEEMEEVMLIAPFLDALDYFRREDFYSYRHFLSVFGLSSLLARDLVPDAIELLHLSTTGPTHDIGKTCVPLEVLQKISALTRAEREMLDNHAAAGYVLLSHYLGDHRGLAARVARDHHERRDRSGYPRGVKLEDRLVEIIAVADVYDALLSPRPYRPVSYDNRTALEEVTSMAERGQIGWPVVQALVARNRRRKAGFEETNVSGEKRGTPPSENLHGIVVDEEEEK
jgi:HD-GYP domain-containing protein (c-di-GMP phosphodiesterase class II)